MRKKTVPLLVCPNDHSATFKIYAVELFRDGQVMKNVEDEDILPDDDIKTGVVISTTSETAFPINNFVGVFLSDVDVDKGNHKMLFEPLFRKTPDSYQQIIQNTLTRIYSAGETLDGNWNRDEMKYYDAEVVTEELCLKMLRSINESMLWRIFLPRRKEIIDKISEACRGKYVLEIGCGNSRTVARMFNPYDFSYNYIGTDISLKRLMVAKMAVPSGDFFQASALNLPFKKGSFKAVISFGMLHHLPRPADAILEADKQITPGGFFGFHEPIYSPRLFSEVTNARFRKFFRRYDHSIHDNKINLDESLSLLQSLGYVGIRKVPYNSVFRVALDALLKKISIKLFMKKSVIRFLFMLDRIVLKTICRVSNKFGPQAIIILAKKQ